MITIFAEIIAQEGKEDKLKLALKEIIPFSLSESGCHEYRICQSQNNSTKFYTYETFDSINDFESHVASSHFMELQEKAKELLAAEPKIEVTVEI